MGKIKGDPNRLDDYTRTASSAVKRTRPEIEAYERALHRFASASPNSLGGPAIPNRSGAVDETLGDLAGMNKGPAKFAALLRKADAASFRNRFKKKVFDPAKPGDWFKVMKWKLKLSLDIYAHPGKYVLGKNAMGVLKLTAGLGLAWIPDLDKALAPFIKGKGIVAGVASAAKNAKLAEVARYAWSKRTPAGKQNLAALRSALTGAYGKLAKAAGRLPKVPSAKPWVNRAKTWPGRVPGSARGKGLWKGRPTWLARKPPKLPPAVAKVTGPVGTIVTAPFEWAGAVTTIRDPKATSKEKWGEGLEGVGAAIGVVGAGATVTGVGAVVGVPLMALGAGVAGVGLVVKNADWVSKNAGKAKKKLGKAKDKISGWFR